MAVSQTTRLGLYRWSAAADEFTRDQMDTSHSLLEQRAARFSTGASLPAHAAEYVQGFFLDTTAGVLYYSNGSAWVAVNSFAAAGAIAPGDTASAGTATSISRSDHRHSMLPFATGTSQVSTAASGGAASTFSRGDHIHTLGTGAVTSTTIASGAINSSAMLASNVVTTSAIADTSVTRAKIEVNERIPTGTILPFVGQTAPSGWALCDGLTAVGSATELGLLLNGRYGTTGSTHFVPDLRGRFPYGGWSGGSAGTWSTATGGAATATLVANNLPQHTHDLGSNTSSTAADHTHGSGTLLNANTNLNHAHTFAHTHTVSPTAGTGSIAVVAQGTSLGTVIGLSTNGNTGGLNFNYTVRAGGDGNLQQSSLFEYGDWVTDSQSNGTVSTALGDHTHTMSGSTGSGGSHSHTITGTSGNNTTTNAAFSILPPFTSINFIIKL